MLTKFTGVALYAYRKGRGYSPEQLSNNLKRLAIEMDPSTIANYERFGRPPFTESQFEGITRALEIQVEDVCKLAHDLEQAYLTHYVR